MFVTEVGVNLLQGEGKGLPGEAPSAIKQLFNHGATG